MSSILICNICHDPWAIMYWFSFNKVFVELKSGFMHQNFPLKKIAVPKHKEKI